MIPGILQWNLWHHFEVEKDQMFGKSLTIIVLFILKWCCTMFNLTGEKVAGRNVIVYDCIITG